MLTLPAEATDAGAITRLWSRYHDRGAAHFLWLRVANRQESAVGNGLDEAGAQRVSGDAKRRDAVLKGHELRYVRMRCTRMDQRAAQRLEELAIQQTPGPVLGHLAGAAGHDVLVALPAALGVVRWPQAVVHGFDFLEDESIVVEGAQCHNCVFVDRVERWTLDVEPVRQVVESGGRLLGSVAVPVRPTRSEASVRRTLILQIASMPEAFATGVTALTIEDGGRQEPQCSRDDDHCEP